jgi:putative ABC transport system permease protein
MNLFKIAWLYLRHKPFNTLLNAMLLGLGIGLVIFLLLVQHQIQDNFAKNGKGISLVVGAKGSPLQLVLCNIYHIDNPTGNIPLEEAEKIANNRRFVKKSIPLALGDNYKGYRIVGTNHDYAKHYKAELATGQWWANVMEVTVGAEVAKTQNLKIGSKFSGAHGLTKDEVLTHNETSFKVVGIMRPTNSVMDKLILTQVESVWKVHEPQQKEGEEEKPKEITALLITQVSNPLANINLPRMINGQTNMQAASPAFELLRLFEFLGTGEQLMRVFAYLVLFLATVSIFIALLNALKERQYDLALMRVLGGSKLKIFSQILLEGLLLAWLGFGLGVLLGHGSVSLLGGLEMVADKMYLTGTVFLIEEAYLFGLATIVGILASLLPAWRVYRMDIARTLSE